MHWQRCVPLLHVALPGHDGHVRVPPQLSGPLPHCQPTCAQVFTAQPQRFGTPSPPQIAGAVHPPQSSSAPQPSLTTPHALSEAQVFGTHGVVPHLFGPAPPQFGRSTGQVAHLKTCPHPEGTSPHSAPCAAQSFGWHVHLCVSALQVVFASAHLPQSTSPPQPSFVSPHSTASASQDFGMHAGGAVAAGLTLPGATQRFAVVSQTSSEGHGHVLSARLIASTPHAAKTPSAVRPTTMALLAFIVLSWPQPRTFARNIWK
jgi:hypothetical protein